MLKRLILVTALGFLIAESSLAQFQDSVRTEGYSSAAGASAAIYGNARGSLLPTSMHQTYGWQQPRISWITVAPYSYDVYNDEDMVQSAALPPTSSQQCYYACPGNTVYVCSTRGIGGPPVLQNYQSMFERDSAYAALDPMLRNYTAKLALPIGDRIWYALVLPGTVHVATPSVICP